MTPPPKEKMTNLISGDLIAGVGLAVVLLRRLPVEEGALELQFRLVQQFVWSKRAW